MITPRRASTRANRESAIDEETVSTVAGRRTNPARLKARARDLIHARAFIELCSIKCRASVCSARRRPELPKIVILLSLILDTTNRPPSFWGLVGNSYMAQLTTFRVRQLSDRRDRGRSVAAAR